MGTTVQKVDVAQRVDELLFLYTSIRLRHQRNKTTVGRIVPSYLPRDYNGDLFGDCSRLLRFRNKFDAMWQDLYGCRAGYLFLLPSDLPQTLKRGTSRSLTDIRHNHEFEN